MLDVFVFSCLRYFFNSVAHHPSRSFCVKTAATSHPDIPGPCVSCLTVTNKGSVDCYLIAYGKLHREIGELQILLQIHILSLPNLRLARNVNIADLVHMHKPPPLKTTIAQSF